MRKIHFLFALVSSVLLISVSHLHVVAQDASNNSISGIVFNISNRPVPDIYVELQNSYYSTIAREKTNSSGTYNFNGLTNGEYKVKVLTFGTNYSAQEKDVSLVSMSAVAGRGAITERVDFYLTLQKREGEFSNEINETIFAQDVPKEAESLFKSGLEFLAKQREPEAFEKLRNAIEVYPNFFKALNRLGIEYLARGYYRQAYVLFTKALDIYPNSYSSNFGLGMTMFRLGEIDESVKRFEKSVELDGQSVSANLWMGIGLFETGNLKNAEKQFSRANRLSNNKSAEVHWQLARLYSRQNKYIEAADELELYLKYNKAEKNIDAIRKTVGTLRQKAKKGQ